MLMQSPSHEMPNQVPKMPELPGAALPEMPALPNLPTGSLMPSPLTPPAP